MRRAAIRDPCPVSIKNEAVIFDRRFRSNPAHDPERLHPRSLLRGCEVRNRIWEVGSRISEVEIGSLVPKFNLGVTIKPPRIGVSYFSFSNSYFPLRFPCRRRCCRRTRMPKAFMLRRAENPGGRASSAHAYDGGSPRRY